MVTKGKGNLTWALKNKKDVTQEGGTGEGFRLKEHRQLFSSVAVIESNLGSNSKLKSHMYKKRQKYLLYLL